MTWNLPNQSVADSKKWGTHDSLLSHFAAKVRQLPRNSDAIALGHSVQGFSKVRILEAKGKGTQIRANLAQMCADNNHL
jgi:hypothetical protein